MFAVLHSDLNSLKSGHLHITGQPYCKESRSAKVQDGMINLVLRNYPIDRYSCQPVFCACISDSYSGYDELRQSADIAVLIAESPKNCGSSFINSIASGFALIKTFFFLTGFQTKKALVSSLTIL
jgi:hypothetical protein